LYNDDTTLRLLCSSRGRWVDGWKCVGHNIIITRYFCIICSTTMCTIYGCRIVYGLWNIVFWCNYYNMQTLNRCMISSCAHSKLSIVRICAKYVFRSDRIRVKLVNNITATVWIDSVKPNNISSELYIMSRRTNY